MLILAKQGAYRDTTFKSAGWAEWYDGHGNIVCSKHVSISQFAIQKSDKLRAYLETFSETACDYRSDAVDENADEKQEVVWSMSILQSYTSYIKKSERVTICSSLRSRDNHPIDGWETD